jgi:hypothetical protein
MAMTSMLLPRLLAVTLLMAAAGPLPAETSAAAPAADLEGLRVALESALARAGRPALFHPAPAASHVYRLKGYGAFIVLTPRAFFASRPVVRKMIRPDLRVRTVTRPASDRPVVIEIPEGTFEVALPDLGALQREMESQMAVQAAVLQEMEATRDRWTHGGEEELQVHLRLVEEQAEAFRVEADRARRQMEKEVWTRLAPPPPPVPPRPAAVPLPPGPPGAPAAAEPMTAPVAPEPPEPFEPPPPPWRFWFETREEEAPAADPETIVSTVREAVVSALESYRRPLSSLRPDDLVTVAVDIVPDGHFRKAAARTILVRVRARDLQDRRAGRLTAAQLRERLEFEED